MNLSPKGLQPLLIVTLAVLIGGCAVPPDEVWNEGDPRVFALADAPAAPAIADEPWAMRHQVIGLNDRLFRADGLQIGDTISVSIFNERSLTGRVDRVETVANHRNVRSRLLPPEEGHILLTIGERRVNGNVAWQTRDRFFYIRFAPDIGEHVFVEADPAQEDVLPTSPPELPPDE